MILLSGCSKQKQFNLSKLEQEWEEKERQRDPEVRKIIRRDLAKHGGFDETKKKAEKGDQESLTTIYLAYMHGEGVPKNLRMAFKFAEIGAMQGSPRWQKTLSYKFESGEGVVKDYIRAYAWANIALSNRTELYMGFGERKDLEEWANNRWFKRLEDRLTKEQVVVAQAMASNLFEQIENRNDSNPINTKFH